MDLTQYYLGIDSVMMLLEQERKHWLLSTNKKKTSQDKRTGDSYLGQIDNRGTSVIAESVKLGTKYSAIKSITYVDSEMNNVLNPDFNAFPYTNSFDGAIIARIISSQYVTSSDRVHYYLKFTNCEECTIPMGAGNGTSDVYPFKWIKTTTAPTICLLDPATSEILSEKSCATNATNCTYFYPLDEGLQPLPVTNVGTTYQTHAVDSDAYIGYPLYWFNCDEFVQMNRMSLDACDDYFAFGNAPTKQFNEVSLYTGLGITPGGDSMSDYKVQVTGDFSNDASDFNKPINKIFRFINTSTTSSTDVTIQCSDSAEFDVLMAENSGWTYINATTYEIPWDSFEVEDGKPVKPIFEIEITPKDITAYNTTDTGAAGFSAKTTMSFDSDASNKYVQDLYNWDGLPEGIAERINQGEGAVVYAVHDVPTVSSPEDRQTAALILDPGDMDDVDNDKGRVFVLSNDPIRYENNATLEHPKPARTAARICDIPTSVVQLSNITGLAPTNVVDKKYVRSECSFTEEDKDRLYNTLGSRWVRPTHLDADGDPVIDDPDAGNEFVFNGERYLNRVDLINNNEFREYTNLNPMVDPYDVSVASIINGGQDYAVNDSGLIIVGGFSFTYVVQEVNAAGSVTRVVIGPSKEGEINLSNFDMMEGLSGVTATYGSSPLTGDGVGLQIRMNIANYADILTKKDEIYPDLFALVIEGDGLWLYTYKITPTSPETPKLGFWVKVSKISDAESSSLSIDEGLSTTDSYINSIIPTTRELPVARNAAGQSLTTLEALTTASCINIVDTEKTPIKLDTDNRSVDMNKFVCDGVKTSVASYKNFDSVLYTLKASNQLTYDSYLLWRWESETDPTNKKFEYAICRRSFNNYQSTDTYSLLPNNDLKYKQYVHTNAGTVVTWSVDKVNQMVWVYNPASTIIEKYTVNQYGKVHIDYVNSTWDKVEIKDDNDGNLIPVVNENHQMLWNVATNNPYQVYYEPTHDDPIYQQPEYVAFEDVVVGSDATSINTQHNPMGSWALVYPRSQTYKVRINGNETNTDLIDMGVVRASNISGDVKVADMNGIDVSESTVIIDQSNTNTLLKIYDKENHMWKTV